VCFYFKGPTVRVLSRASLDVNSPSEDGEGILFQSTQADHSCRCGRRRNWRRNPCSRSLCPSNAMENQNDKPTGECDQAAWNGNKHEPSHHAEIVKKLPIIMSID